MLQWKYMTNYSRRQVNCFEILCYAFTVKKLLFVGVGRKIRNLRLAYKKIWQRDGFNAKWRHFRNLAFLQSSSTNMDTEVNDREYQYDDSCYEPPFVTLNCNNDETPYAKVGMSVLQCHDAQETINRLMDSFNAHLTNFFFSWKDIPHRYPVDPPKLWENQPCNSVDVIRFWNLLNLWWISWMPNSKRNSPSMWQNCYWNIKRTIWCERRVVATIELKILSTRLGRGRSENRDFLSTEGMVERISIRQFYFYSRM